MVYELDRTDVRPHWKEEENLHSSAETGKDTPASPRTNRRDRSSGHFNRDQPRDYCKVIFLIMLFQKMTRKTATGNSSQSLIDRANHAVFSIMFTGISLLNSTANQQFPRQRQR